MYNEDNEVVKHMNQWVVSAEQMKAFDRLTMKRDNISTLELVWRVGKTLTSYTLSKELIVSSDEVCVVAGVGNNGSDALVMASELFLRGLQPIVFLVGNQASQTKPSKQLVKTLRSQSILVNVVEKEADLEGFKNTLNGSSVVIDGIFGIGLAREITGIYKTTIELINQSDVRVISLDLPSGIHADNGCVQGVSVIAIDTLIIQVLKQGHVLNEGWTHCGQRHIIDVGIVGDYLEDEHVLLDPYYYQRFIDNRPMLSHKYDYGNVLVIGGSKGMMGASQLAGMAALRSGSGLVSILYHEIDTSYITAFYPELMISTFNNQFDIQQQLKKKDVVVFGMGIQEHQPVYKEVLEEVLKTDVPLIIDATGLMYYKELMNQYKNRGNIIITPHTGEMARFLDIDVDTLRRESVSYVKQLAKEFDLTIVLKGAVTLISNKCQVYFAQFANPGMATAGSGDVLAGIIGSFAGQKLSCFDAAVTGVSLHSHAGNWAKHTYGEASLIASDIIKGISYSIKR